MREKAKERETHMFECVHIFGYMHKYNDLYMREYVRGFVCVCETLRVCFRYSLMNCPHLRLCIRMYIYEYILYLHFRKRLAIFIPMLTGVHQERQIQPMKTRLGT